MGLNALFWVIITTTLMMWFIEPLLPHRDYYVNNDFTLKNFLIGLIVYMFSFDTWFYFTHVALHHPLAMKYVHNQHH